MNKYLAEQAHDLSSSPDDGDEYIIKSIYRLAKKECDIFFAVDCMIRDLPENRKQTAPRNPDSVSSGYAEITKVSLERVMATVKQFLGDNDSTILDIGSGFGKVVLHAYAIGMFSRAVGIEYIATRYRLAVHLLKQLNELHGVSTFSGVSFVNVDVTHMVTLDYTVIYMFDWVFSQELKVAILRILRSSTFKVFLSC